MGISQLLILDFGVEKSAQTLYADFNSRLALWLGRNLKSFFFTKSDDRRAKSIVRSTYFLLS